MYNRLTLEALAPSLFVLVWSTGWIVAKYSNAHADPLTFLTVRFAGAAVVFGIIAIGISSNWPRTAAGWFHALFSGLFLHTIYLGGIWWAIQQGVPASVSGLLAALQPLMTAMLAYWLVSERLSARQRLGIVMGLAGLMIAIGPGLLELETNELSNTGFLLFVNVIAMLAVTIGTIYQKRFLQEGDLIPVATLQYVGAFVFILPGALLVEPELRFVINAESVLALLWSIFGLSLGAIILLLFLIRHGQVSRAASLIYLIPPTVGIEAWLMFGEVLTLPLILGTIVVVIGVWLVNEKRSISESA